MSSIDSAASDNCLLITPATVPFELDYILFAGGSIITFVNYFEGKAGEQGEKSTKLFYLSYSKSPADLLLEFICPLIINLLLT